MNRNSRRDASRKAASIMRACSSSGAGAIASSSSSFAPLPPPPSTCSSIPRCRTAMSSASRPSASPRHDFLPWSSIMKSHTRVAVIGGGVVGCSVLYHLTKAGWKDVVLIERDQLTAGSTWHAAGGFHTLNGDPNVAKLQGYTIALYDELERISGQSCGLHRSGGLLLADTPERMGWLKMAHARARYLGLETSLLSPREAKQLLPLIEEKYFVGAMLDAAKIARAGVRHLQ